MRVTNSMIQRAAVMDARHSMSQLLSSQTQLGSGRRVSKPSDDPVAAREVFVADREMTHVEQFRRNIVHARSRMSKEEEVINQLSEVVLKASEIAVAEASATRSATTRTAMQGVVDQLLGHVLNLGNTQVAGHYIFSGHQIDAPAFSAAGAYLGDMNEWKVEIDEGTTIAANRNGDRLFVATGVIAALQGLSASLGANNVPGIQTAIGDLQTAFGNVQKEMTDVGGRWGVMEATDGALEEQLFHAKVRKSDHQDIDFSQTLSEFTMRRSAVEAALAAASKALDLNPTKYFF